MEDKHRKDFFDDLWAIILSINLINTSLSYNLNFNFILKSKDIFKNNLNG